MVEPCAFYCIQISSQQARIGRKKVHIHPSLSKALQQQYKSVISEYLSDWHPSLLLIVSN